MERHGSNQKRMIFVRDLLECPDEWSVASTRLALTTDHWTLVT